MAHEVEYTDEFEDWWIDLSADAQESIAVVVTLLEERGPRLGYPHSSGIAGSKFGHMRELRIQHKGEPYRVFYAFDPRRTAVLLVGACKLGDDRFYERMISKADAIYATHIAQLKSERDQSR